MQGVRGEHAHTLTHFFFSLALFCLRESRAENTFICLIRASSSALPLHFPVRIILLARIIVCVLPGNCYTCDTLGYGNMFWGSRSIRAFFVLVLPPSRRLEL